MRDSFVHRRGCILICIALITARCNSKCDAQGELDPERERIVLLRDIRHRDGFAFTVKIPMIRPNERDDGQTSLRIFENGQALGPGRVRHVVISAKGQGRFSHWGDTLYFSASDNSDPRTNGRLYTIRVQDVPPAMDVLHIFESTDLEPDEGHAWQARLPLAIQGWSDDSLRFGHSRLILLENGWPLREPYAPKARTRQVGLGAYLVHDDAIFFSTTDHSDPRTNGRLYSIALGPSPDHRFTDPAVPQGPDVVDVLAPVRLAFPRSGEHLDHTHLEAAIANPDPSLLYYWEIDVAPTFDSPSLHRRPAIGVGVDGLNPLYIVEREGDFGSSFKLPYRVGALAALPEERPGAMGPVDILSARLAFGLDPEAAAHEIYAYVSSQFYRSSPLRRNYRPEEMVILDRGLCSNVNALAVRLLESAGIAGRLVRVRDPELALINEMGGGSHIGAEAYMNGAWGIFDPWLEFESPGVSYRDVFNGHPLGNEVIVNLGPRKVERLSAAGVHLTGPTLCLRDYVQERAYFPGQLFFPVMGDNSADEVRMLAAEPRWVPDAPFGLLWNRKSLKVYLRVRGIRASHDVVRHFLRAPPQLPQPKLVEVTPWTAVQVTVDLRRAYGVDQ